MSPSAVKATAGFRPVNWPTTWLAQIFLNAATTAGAESKCANLHIAGFMCHRLHEETEIGVFGNHLDLESSLMANDR